MLGPLHFMEDFQGNSSSAPPWARQTCALSCVGAKLCTASWAPSSEPGVCGVNAMGCARGACSAGAQPSPCLYLLDDQILGTCGSPPWGFCPDSASILWCWMSEISGTTPVGSAVGQLVPPGRVTAGPRLLQCSQGDFGHILGVMGLAQPWENPAQAELHRTLQQGSGKQGVAPRQPS